MDIGSYAIYSAIRDELGYTDSAVSRGSGIPKSSISDWKRGIYIPKADKLQKIADFFGVSLFYLQTGYELENEENILGGQNKPIDVKSEFSRLLAKLDSAPLLYDGKEINDNSAKLAMDALNAILTQLESSGK